MANSEVDEEPRDLTGDDASEETGSETWMERISRALEEHCGLDLGTFEDCDDPDHFAALVEIAAANSKRGNENRKAKVRMSQTRKKSHVKTLKTLKTLKTQKTSSLPHSSRT